MKNERLGLIMLAATAAVVCLILWLVYAQHVRSHRDSVGIQGVAITRILSRADMSQLMPRPDQSSLIATLAGLKSNDAFAYGALVGTTGAKLYEVASPGSTVPAATMPSDPPAWFGEHSLVSPGDGRPIREFFGPVLKNGELAGFVRSGYYESPAHLMATMLSNLALFALPVFLLTAMSYFLIRREILPLAAIGAKFEALGAPVDTTRAGNALELSQFLKRFEQQVDGVHSRIGTLEMQRLEEQASNRVLSYKQEKTQAVLDALPEAVLVLDDTLAPVYANPKVERFLGIGRSGLIGKDAASWCKNEALRTMLARLRQQAGAGQHPSTVNYTPDDNPEIRVSVTAVPLLTPRDPANPFGTLVTFRDVSGEYFARQAGTDFVAHVAHELKAPLNTLLAYSELLLDFGTLGEGERVNAVNVIHDEVERAAALINNLLNISKLEAGTLPVSRQRVKLADLLRDSVEKMSQYAATRGVALESRIATDLGSVEVDKELLRIALDNILGNGIKYSDAGGKVTLGAARVDEREIRISVRDNGIGMSPQDCQKAFDKFYRSSDPLVAARSGHGLGLHIARQIVELHHGKLTVESELGKGTRFTLQISAHAARLLEAPKA